MYTIGSEFHKIDRKKWANFVSTHPNGNIFHTPEIVELYTITPKQKPLIIVCYDQSNEIVGILSSVIQKEYSGLLATISSRAIVFGGPLVLNNNQEIASLIIMTFNNLCKNKVLYSQFRNIWDIRNYYNIFINQGYIYEDHLDILFDLKLGVDNLWKDIHPTRRKQINRGVKREIETKIKDDLNLEELSACYQILKQVYTDVKLPFPNFDFFKNAQRLLCSIGYLKTVLAIHKHEIIGFRFFLCYKGLLYDWYAGSLVSHYDKYPNDILPWEIIKWGAENNYNTFDFGGAGKPNKPYGVRDYKKKFGGEFVNFGRYEKVHMPLLMIFAKMGFKIWRILRKK